MSGGIKSKVKILQHALSTEVSSFVTLEEKHLQYTNAWKKFGYFEVRTEVAKREEEQSSRTKWDCDEVANKLKWLGIDRVNEVLNEIYNYYVPFYFD